MRQSRRVLAALTVLVVTLSLTACSVGRGPASSDRRTGLTDAHSEAGGETAAEDSASDDDSAPDADQRSVVRTADISIIVDDPAAVAEDAAAAAVKLGGDVSSSSVTGSDEAYAELRLRVPADRLDTALAELGKLGTVESKSTTADDVTGEHVDLQARVKALQASVDRLTELMRNAKSTSDLLKAEENLSARQQELDGLRAQLKQLDGQIEYATVSVSLVTEAAEASGGPDTFWEGLLAGFGSVGAFAAGALVVLGVLLPWLVIAAVIAAAVIWTVRSARSRRASQGVEDLPVTPSNGANNQHTEE